MKLDGWISTSVTSESDRIIYPLSVDTEERFSGRYCGFRYKVLEDKPDCWIVDENYGGGGVTWTIWKTRALAVIAAKAECMKAKERLRIEFLREIGIIDRMEINL